MERSSGAPAIARLAVDGDPARRATRRLEFAAVVIGALCLVAAFGPVRAAVRGVALPYDIDEFRDIAAAQALADGKGLQDPFYRDETLWYNPLLGAAVATISRATATEVPSAYVQAGPYLNALAPALFFLLGIVLFDSWAALLALAFFLYSPAYMSAWATPSYSPWLYPVSFTSAAFYVGVLAAWAAIGSQRAWAWVAVGAALGLTFLGHTAPAMVLGACVLAAAYGSPGDWRARTGRAVTDG